MEDFIRVRLLTVVFVLLSEVNRLPLSTNQTRDSNSSTALAEDIEMTCAVESEDGVGIDHDRKFDQSDGTRWKRVTWVRH